MTETTYGDYLTPILDRLERLERHAGLVADRRGCPCGMPECSDPPPEPRCACGLDIGCQLHDAETPC